MMNHLKGYRHRMIHNESDILMVWFQCCCVAYLRCVLCVACPAHALPCAACHAYALRLWE